MRYLLSGSLSDETKDAIKRIIEAESRVAETGGVTEVNGDDLRAYQLALKTGRLVVIS